MSLYLKQFQWNKASLTGIYICSVNKRMAWSQSPYSPFILLRRITDTNQKRGGPAVASSYMQTIFPTTAAAATATADVDFAS
jgi:hypothetical protein